jgi:sulfatase-like protein
MKTRPWLEGGGLAMLYLLPLIAIFLSPGHGGLYHQVLPITSLTRGGLIDLLLLGFLLGLWLAWLGGTTSRLMQQLLWIPILFLTAWVTERGIAEYFHTVSVGIQVPAWASNVPWMVPAAALLLLLFSRKYYDFTIRATEVFLMSAGIATIFVILPRFVIETFNHAPPEQAAFAHPVRQSWHPGEPRVVWLLFDELSYDQLFDHRQPSINLPAFTRLKQESVSFSQLVPAGNLTELIIPSLFLGRTITEVKSNREGQLFWRSNSEMGWQNFQPEATVFAAARRQGWGTGVAGWYNPYCRLLATTLDRCYWTFQEFTGGGRFSHLSSEQSTLENARDGFPFVAQVERVLQHRPANESHEDDYRRVLKEAKSLIQDQSIRFAFIHLPVPHPPGIFPDPTPSGGGHDDYLGNLILADQALAELRTVISGTAAASDTILIVSSDHSWRVSIWRGMPGWTRAEEHASRAAFDSRPVLMVHFSNQTPEQSDSIDRPQNAMILNTLLLDIFTGKVSNLQELKQAVM